MRRRKHRGKKGKTKKIKEEERKGKRTYSWVHVLHLPRLTFPQHPC